MASASLHQAGASLLGYTPRLPSSTSLAISLQPRSQTIFLRSRKVTQFGSHTRLSPPAASLDSSLNDDWDNEEDLDPEEVKAAYDALYGESVRQSYSGDVSKVKVKSAADDESIAAAAKKGKRGKKSSDDDDSPSDSRRQKDEFEDRLVEVRRVTKVVKGGKQLSFRAVVIVGDKNGRVGVGVGKAKEVVIAVQKAGLDARRHLVKVPLTKELTFPHRADGFFGAAQVMLRPAAIGTGVIAGGSVRVVLELAGIENALGKQLGSGNALNNARAVLDAVSNMKEFESVSKMRGITIQELWK